MRASLFCFVYPFTFLCTFLDAQLLFHLSSNLWKRIEQLGFQQSYTENAEFPLHLRMIGALVLNK